MSNPHEMDRCVIAEDQREYEYLNVCQLLYRRRTGATSPFEEFIENLIRYAGTGRYPEPGLVEDWLATYRKDLDDLRHYAAEFAARFGEGDTNA